MNILIIGGGGREHAIAYTINKSNKVSKIYAIPGNPGISAIATCVNGSVEDFPFILKFVEENSIDYTIIGPEVPLCMGLADLLEDNGHKVFGPRKESANLEGSKAFSKDFMKRHRIPTANYVEVTSYDDAVSSLSEFSYPLVVKADGLAAGKGVVICQNYDEAITALTDIMVDDKLQGAGSKVVIEEFLTGYECSLLCFCDGETIIPMVSAKDHKQIYDHNLGPNTGGMGTLSPNFLLREDLDEVFDEKILKPFVKGVQEDNLDFRGVIFIGLMIEGKDVKVLEFNVRFGDPETQVILLRLESDLLDIMLATSEKRLADEEVVWKKEQALCVVLSAAGYPAAYEKGKVITGINDVNEDIIVFHAGTKMVDGNLVSNGGRVLNICALDTDLETCRKKVYEAAQVINFDGKYYRSDIGKK
ncbi:MAG: phosphoribosylamine--glycine ligase [Erysipelotrichaceae bacterium]